MKKSTMHLIVKISDFILCYIVLDYFEFCGFQASSKGGKAQVHD